MITLGLDEGGSLSHFQHNSANNAALKEVICPIGLRLVLFVRRSFYAAG